jgi:hypothetical protein
LQEWQGLQASHILVDEAAEFSQEEILFLIRVCAVPNTKGTLNITMTCNPHRDSFLFDWVKFSLDEVTGVPFRALRIRSAGSSTLAVGCIGPSLLTNCGRSTESLSACPGARDIKKINFHPKSFRFIPLTIYDNPVLLKNNPGYLANLLSQPRVNQLRYLHGSWTAKAEGAGFFRREWVRVIEPHELPPNMVGRVRSWDLAGSIPSETYPNPDWTAGVKMSRDRFGYYYIEDVERFRKLSDGVLKGILDCAQRDGKDDVHRHDPERPRRWRQDSQFVLHPHPRRERNTGQIGRCLGSLRENLPIQTILHPRGATDGANCEGRLE